MSVGVVWRYGWISFWLVIMNFVNETEKIVIDLQIIPKIHNRNYRKYLQGRHILQLPQHPPLHQLGQLGQCTVFWCHLLTRDIAREYSAVKHQSISSKAMLKKEETELTSSTTLTDPFTRDRVVQSHSVYPNSYILSLYADTPVQFLKLMVRHYYITRRPFTWDKVV